MHSSISELQFAQRFPFSREAKNILRENNLSLDELPEEVLARAEAMALNAAKGKDYYIELRSSELLLQEILAFPIAKILVSMQKDSMLNDKFAFMLSKSFLKYLDLEKNRKDTALELARQLGIEFEIAADSGEGFFVSIPLQNFLKIHFRRMSLKLVNQHVALGKVFLQEKRFFDFLAETILSAISASLPVPLEGIPNSLKNSARQLQQMLLASRKEFETKISGKINPNLFSDCMKSMYADLVSGKHMTHIARFYIATFLNSIGMTKEQLLELFSKQGNYNERIARYHIDRIVKQNLSPPGCAKVREAGLCPTENCQVRHPMSFYRRELKALELQEKAGRHSS